MKRANSLILAIGMVVLGTPVAHAQYTAKEWPEGPSKQRFADTCGGCHDINRGLIG
jgi:virginiamycin B lyase